MGRFSANFVQEVACVIHYQLPAAADVYVHRCGRTARASAEGISVALVTPKEQARFSALCKVTHFARMFEASTCMKSELSSFVLKAD